MASFEYLADGHHVDDAGHPRPDRAVPDHRPAEGLVEAARHTGLRDDPDLETKLLPPTGRRTRRRRRVPPRHERLGLLRVHRAGEAAWFEAMPAGCGAVSPIRRPRVFARALGAMVAEQAGPRGRIVLLRSTFEGRTFCTHHRSQTVYHGPVVYSEDPRGRLARASLDLELLLLLVFLKDAAMRAQRESRFAVWMEQQPEEDTVDLEVSPALVDAMWKPRPEPEGSGLVPAGASESSTIEEIDGGGSPRERMHVEVLPAFAARSNPAVAPRRYDAEELASDLREAATAHASVEALREAVERADAGDATAAAAAWHAEPWYASSARPSATGSPACA